MHACSTCACLSINSGAFSGSMPVILDNLPQEAWNNIFNILHIFCSIARENHSYNVDIVFKVLQCGMETFLHVMFHVCIGDNEI